MDPSDNFYRELMETFQAELQEHIGILTDGCLALEKNPPEEASKKIIEELFRAAHTMKGATRAVGLENLGLLAHRMEDVFGAIRQGEVVFSPELGDLMLHVLDYLGQADLTEQDESASEDRRLTSLLDELKAASMGEPFSVPLPDDEARPKAEPVPAPPKTPAGGGEPGKAPPPGLEAAAPETAPAPLQATGPAVPAGEVGESCTPAETGQAAVEAALSGPTIRVGVDKLDALMDGMMELLVARMRPAHRLDELNLLRKKLSTWETGWRQARGVLNQLRRRNSNDPQLTALVQYLNEGENNLRELSRTAGRIARGMASDSRQLTLLTDEMQLNVHRVRMLPLSNLFSIFPRLVRDVARESGKQVELIMEGQNTEVDRQVLEAMKGPLTHLLRNAVDHGIEPPQVRVAAGKPATGRIVLSAFQKGSAVVLEVKDDGAGIDAESVRRTAESKGLLNDETEAAGLEYQDLIFRSGFSTQERVSRISGRGVGLDVVKKGVEALQGLVTLESRPGQGAKFTLMLPLTLVTTNTLLLKVGPVTVAVPSTAVERIHRIKAASVGSVEGRSVVELNGRAIPLVYLGRLLGLGNAQEPENDENLLVVVIGLADKRAGFVVDSMRGTREVVVKNLGGQIKKLANVEGAAILGSGEVIVVLNISDLLTSARQGAVVQPKSAEDKQAKQVPLILVVDDSITTRTLEKNILETSGYRVEVASDGEGAWTLMQRFDFDLTVSDVDMPRLDGYGLARRIKGDERYRDMPVVLVTSMDSEEDKLKGMQSGADAYITKGQFDQGHLLETIERLIG